MGRLRRRWRLQRLPSGRRGLGPRPPARDQRELGRCQSLCGVAVAQERQDLPAAERSGTRIRHAGRNVHAVLVGLHDLGQPGQLRWPSAYNNGPKGEFRGHDPAGRIRSSRTRGAFTRYTAMCGSGRRIAINRATTARRSTARPGSAAICPRPLHPRRSLGRSAGTSARGFPLLESPYHAAVPH